MSNQLRLTQRIKDSTLIDFLGATYSVTAGVIARAVGDTVAITVVADAGGGDVTITAPSHGLVVNEYVTQDTVDSDYDGTYLVKSITDGDNYVITETWGGSTTTGTFVDAFQESPAGGEVQRIFYPAGASSPSCRINLDSAQNIYPNFGMIFKTRGTTLPSSWELSLQPQTDNNTHFWKFNALTQRLMGYVDDEWANFSFINGLKVEGGTVLPWATGESDQAFVTSSFNLFASTGGVGAPGRVFYIAAIYTENYTKAKVILTFDDFPATVNTEALPRLQAKGWKAGVAAVGSTMDDAAGRARVQQLYDAGWDIMNHSWSHTLADETMSDGTWIEDVLSSQNWQIENGWTRGSNFIAYPFVEAKLLGNDAGDVADRYFALGRGATSRVRYGSQLRSSARRDNTLNNQIPDDAMSISGVADAYATLYATGAAGSVKARLAEAVKAHSVIVVYMHGLLATGGSASDNTIVWFEAFLADIQGYVDAGTLEVVRMSDWQEELSGMPADPTNGNHSFFVQG